MRYAIPGNWWPERLTISDDAGTPRFEVRNSPGFTTMLSLSVAGGEEIATIRRRRGGGFQVVVRGKDAGLVRWRDRFSIDSTLWSLVAVGSVTDGQYSISHDGLALATVSRQLTDGVRPMQTLGVDIGDEDAVTLLAMVLAVEAVRYEHAGAYFNPRALLDLLNPLNWSRV
jgi:uncharacterized protein YxjI